MEDMGKIVRKLKRYSTLFTVVLIVVLIYLVATYSQSSYRSDSLGDRNQLSFHNENQSTISQQRIIHSNQKSKAFNYYFDENTKLTFICNGPCWPASKIPKDDDLSNLETVDSKPKKIYKNTGTKTRKVGLHLDSRGWVYKGSEYMRCKVFTIGCFGTSQNKTSSKDKLTWRAELPEMTESYCVKSCAEKWKIDHITFAGIRNGNICECSPQVNILTNFVQSSECNVPCAGDKTSTCGGKKNITMLYRISGQCSPGVSLSDEEIEESFIGCYRKPSNLYNQMVEYKVDRENSTANCILQCEHKGLTLAIPAEAATCLCGHSTANFDLTKNVDKLLCRTHPSMHIMVYRTIVEDRRCGTRKFLEEGEKHASVLLSTFPGSGNTWTRYLIESLTGIYTGSRYDDDSLMRGGHIGEHLPYNDDKMLVFKSHRTEDLKAKSPFDAFIHIYRNPYDALLSEFNRRRAGGHTNVIDPTNFPSESFHRYAQSMLPLKWRRMTESALQSDKPVLMFSYEDLVKNPMEKAEEMTRFILGNKTDEDDLQTRILCLKLSAAGEFKRKKKKLDFDPYSRQDKIYINQQIDLLNEVFKSYGKGGLLDGYKREV